ncbi:MAG: hypothetical protein U0R69_14290 [Gaiellales bacterium]
MDEHADGAPRTDEEPPGGEALGPPPEEAPGPTQGPDAAAVREAIDRLVSAGIGAVEATAGKAESFLGASGAGQRLGERATSVLAGLLDDLGLVKRERFDELELKVAQLEHRLRLLEERPPGGPPPPPRSGR